MNWDYNNISGDFWNDKTHNEQLLLLKEHYPIGYIFHYIQPLSGLPASCLYSSRYMCEIVAYELVGKADSILSNNSGWYNLRVRNIGEELIEVRRHEYETIHVGFFYPDRCYFRNKKLEQLTI